MFLWNLSILSTIKIFIYRVCLDALPTLANLYKRKVALSSCCKRYDGEAESIARALFWRVKPLSAWNVSLFGDLFAGFKSLSGFDIIRWLFSNTRRADFEFVCVLLWSLWHDHNLSLHNGKLKSGIDIHDDSVSLLKEFQNTQKAFKVSKDGFQDLSSLDEVLCWIPPPPGSLKLNFNVAIRKDLPFAGIGAAVRDSSRLVPRERIGFGSMLNLIISLLFLNEIYLVLKIKIKKTWGRIHIN
ncbi:hypothetical protein ACOSP7_004878 [Xanthoceras sorbifolium]